MLKTRDIDVTFDADIGAKLRADVDRYCATLEANGLPPIMSGEHLALMMGVEPSYLFGVTNSQRYFYRSFEIAKRAGGTRPILEPLPLLKLIQRWILDNILSKVPVEKCVNSYCCGKSIKSNSRLHIGQKKLLKLDVEKFFDSIKIGHVYNLFYNFGYSRAVSLTLSNVCCMDGRLPQGAPTSGYISNLVLKEIDREILDFCLERKIRYTRYADDLSFSGQDFDDREVLQFVRSRLGSIDLTINSKKTKILTQSSRQIVTGVVVNKKLAVPRNRRNRIRQEIYYVKKFGIEGHAAKINDDPEKTIMRILGECSYVNSIHSEPVFSKSELASLREILLKYRSGIHRNG